jgi:DNA-binding response OmpR family regulator
VDEAPPTLAVIDDDAQLRDVLRTGLEQRGFLVRPARDGITGLQLIEREPVHAIVLDLHRPAIDGITLIPLLRSASDAPIIVLSAKDDVASCIASLNAGADDYMTKPFALDELAARLQSALRRPQLREVTVIACADLQVDTARRHVERGGETIALTAREFDILTTLVRQPGRIFTREQLVDLIWSPRSVRSGTVDSYISVLRAKVDRPPRRALIQTVRGVGYRLRQD